MRRSVRPFLTASIAAAGASILIAAPVHADPGPDPQLDRGIDEIIRLCDGNEQCVRDAVEEECDTDACRRMNPDGVLVGAGNPNGLSIGAANQNSGSPGASSQQPGSPGPNNKNGNGTDPSNNNGNGPNGNKKNSP